MSTLLPEGDWQTRLDYIMDMMREMSRQTDPSQMVREYAARTQALLERDRVISLSRRGHESPELRITRDSNSTVETNPWFEQHKHPRVRGGLLADLIYGDEPRVINDLTVPLDDPAHEWVGPYKSLMAIPLFDQGAALNMVLFLRREPNAYRSDGLPETVWMSNLFGRATHNLVLTQELRRAYDEVDKELLAVARIQRSLLPDKLPEIPTLDLAAYYQTSRRAGGDYYDLFPLTDGRWGILIADVSGHGTPAAVVMAITHTLAHTYPEPPDPPGALLTHLNQQLARYYTADNGTFVTAFYGIYDPHTRALTYASAGHDPPRLKRCTDGSLILLNAAGGLPLGVIADESYAEATQQLQVGDQIVFYTDGITEAFNAKSELFGKERLDQVLTDCRLTAQGLIDAVMASVDEFAAGHPADDDRTVLVAKVV